MRADLSWSLSWFWYFSEGFPKKLYFAKQSKIGRCLSRNNKNNNCRLPRQIQILIATKTMPNIHGLHSLRNNNNSNNNATNKSHHRDDDVNNSDDDDEGNDRYYVGGVDSRGGGSGLAVIPNNRENDNNNDRRRSAAASTDAIFNLAEPDTAAAAGSSARATTTTTAGGGGGGGAAHHRTIITMYRSGFTVDNGPYRRLDDPANSEFLTSMARGHVPRELRDQAAALLLKRGDGDNADEVPEVMVGLVDRRSEEYDPERHHHHGGGSRRGEEETTSNTTGFQSFSGEGQSLGGTVTSSGGAATAAASSGGGGIIDPTTQSNYTNLPPPPLDPNVPSTSIAIRLLNGTRLVIKVNVTSPVSELGQHIATAQGMDNNNQPYVLTSGYPPRIVEDLNISIEEAGLMGSQVVLKAV